MDVLIILITVILIASANGLLGSFLILRNSVMIGDAISHSILPGLVIGFLISGSKAQFPMLISAAITGFLCTFLIQLLSKSGKLPKDASIGFVFTFLFAIGIILVSLYTADIDIDPDCVLHGELGYLMLDPAINVLGISIFPVSTWISLTVFLIVLLFIVFFYNPLFLTCFDPEYSKTIGLKINYWETLIMALLSATTVISFDSVGAILVIGFMVIPSASAYLISKKLKTMMLITLLYGAISCVIGFYLSSILNSSISSAIVCIMGLFFMLTLAFTLARKAYRLRLQ